ncbi:MAG: GNAT family N-acetyltransferase [Symploca sp. SIO3C6]|uniref:GNAT family N-acetyltransferase n=1 Tax=Symploca sp. SIO1C4 TaxID=2607765 RepID=A0A6B3NBF9_9CYAN|nr:GNAT family N-acetyltransferase [Symploca sp. SIO3C6]NER26518.1 GNAT family N-acetyltransferase [Symploca sp. SIO1C4]NET07536.1 GNAT family N-acetyltransferase [Symploca sp. SIO2B6]
MNFTINEGLLDEEAEMLGNCIDTYNSQQTGFTDERPLKLAARDSEGNLLGGLMGSTGFEWLYIHVLWIEEPHRNCRIGSSLVEHAERLGIQRGCRSSCLMTFSFQAKDFYDRLGYVVFGQLDDYPEGHTLYFMQKKLTTT